MGKISVETITKVVLTEESAKQIVDMVKNSPEARDLVKAYNDEFKLSVSIGTEKDTNDCKLIVGMYAKDGKEIVDVDKDDALADMTDFADAVSAIITDSGNIEASIWDDSPYTQFTLGYFGTTIELELTSLDLEMDAPDPVWLDFYQIGFGKE